MIAHQMSEYIKSRISSITADVWNKMNINYQTEDIWNDLARINGDCLEATFYIKGLDNVVRKDFNEHAQLLKQNNPNVAEFKVKFKRPEKEVRFYLKVTK